MPPTAMEQTLADLPRVGVRIKHRPYRQVWRFEHDGRAYYLKFYPRTGPRDMFRRLFRGSPAVAEFTRLQALQQAKVPAPRGTAVLDGFVLEQQRGDAVILEAIEPSVQLDQHLAGSPRNAAEHRSLVQQVIALVQQLQEAGLGHEDLHPGNFLLHDGRVFLLDGYAVRKRGMRRRDLLMLGHSVRRFATTTDLLRGWRALRGSEPFPRTNPISTPLWDGFVKQVTRRNRYFGRLKNHGDGWRGTFYQRTKSPRPESVASRLEPTSDDWQREWPALWARVDADGLPVLKRSGSGDVLAGSLTLAGQAIEVIIKRPRRKHWYRYVNEIGRGSRARRAWRKAWHLVTRGLPTAWPLLLMERRVGGYVVDALLVCERVPGATLAHVDLKMLSAEARENLMHRTGRILRLIERFGFSHFDAKASNWIVYEDPAVGPTPVLIDVDGVRRRRWIALGIQRLLRSLQQENPSYTPTDSFNLCRGYAPYGRSSLAPSPTLPGEGRGEGDFDRREPSDARNHPHPHPHPLPHPLPGYRQSGPEGPLA